MSALLGAEFLIEGQHSFTMWHCIPLRSSPVQNPFSLWLDLRHFAFPWQILAGEPLSEALKPESPVSARIAVAVFPLAMRRLTLRRARYGHCWRKAARMACMFTLSTTTAPTAPAEAARNARIGRRSAEAAHHRWPSGTTPGWTTVALWAVQQETGPDHRTGSSVPPADRRRR